MSPNNTICTFADSNRFKNSDLFSQTANSLQLKLYIEAYDTTNPLGDLRKNYKMQGVYFKVNIKT